MCVENEERAEVGLRRKYVRCAVEVSYALIGGEEDVR